MQRRIIPDSENRLLILYTLDKLGPVSASQLLQFMVDNDLMNYFEMQLNLNELCDQKMVESSHHPMDELKHISATGIETLRIFYKKIPQSRREKVDHATDSWKVQFLNEQQMPAATIDTNEEGCCIRLRILENQSALLDILLVLSQNEKMDRLQERWKKTALFFYQYLMSVLGQKVTYDAKEIADNSHTLSRRIDEHNWLLTLKTIPESGTTFMITLPTEELCNCFAENWAQSSQNIISVLRDRLKTSVTGEFHAD